MSLQNGSMFALCTYPSDLMGKEGLTSVFMPRPIMVNWFSFLPIHVVSQTKQNSFQTQSSKILHSVPWNVFNWMWLILILPNSWWDDPVIPSYYCLFCVIQITSKCHWYDAFLHSVFFFAITICPNLSERCKIYNSCLSISSYNFTSSSLLDCSLH